MAYIKKADAEKQFVQEVLDAGGVKSYYEMYEHGNYYYCFDLNNGTRRYWTNLSEENAEILGISIRE